MLSSEKKISSEDQIPCVNKEYHKSIGRTPLQELTGQHNSSDQRITRSYSKRLSGLTDSLSSQTLKESSKSNTSTPVHACNDSYPAVVLTDCARWKGNKLKPCSLSKCKFEKLNDVKPTENLDSNCLPIHSDKNPKLTHQVTLPQIDQFPDVEVKKSAEASSEERSSSHLAAEEGLVTSESETDAHQIADSDSSALVTQKSCVPGTENMFNVCRVRPVAEIQCSMQKDEHNVNASGSYTAEHKDCYSLLSEDILGSYFNNQPFMSTVDATWHSSSGETSPVQLCPSQSRNECLSVSEEFERIVKLDNMMTSTTNDPYLNVTQEVVEQACVTSPNMVASVLLGERESRMAVINEELSLLESTRGILNETYNLQDLLKPDGADLHDIFTPCLPTFSLVNQTDCLLDTGEILKGEMTKDADPSKTSSNLVPSIASDQSNCTYFLAIRNSTEHSCFTESVDENLSSENFVLQSEKLPSDVYINESANDCTSFTEGEVEDAVSSTESPMKKQPAHHHDHDYISAVSEALTPFLCRSGHLSHSACQTHGVASMTPLTQLHPTMLGSPMSCKSKGSKKIQSVGNSPLECGTCITPISHSSVATWITPIMLLNKSINTLQDSKGRDNASETDYLPWNFSQESLRDASREELISRLEGSLIVVQVLSHQLQEWQKDVGSSRPSEQRDTSSQTVVSYVSTDEQYYHNLYIQTLGRLQSLQRTHEEEQHLLQVLRKAMEALESHKKQTISLTEFTEKFHDMMQYDIIDLLSQSRVLVADQTALSQGSEKMQCNLQRDEIKAQLENALCAKEEMDQNLKNLKIHYSRVIAKLRRDLESEKRLSVTVKQAYEQQRSSNNDFVQFTRMFQSVCKEAEDDRTHLQLQCTDAKELMSQYNRVFEIMKEKTQTALQDHETLKCERDSAYFENEELCNQVNDLKSQNDRLKTETSRLTSELASLMKHVCDVKSESDQMRQDYSQLEEELCAKSSSLKLLEKELNEATARALVFQDRNRELTGDIVPRLEQERWEAVEHYSAMKNQLKDLETQHASQIAIYTESIEFLEQENYVSREQVCETESQLKSNLFALRERNLQCANQKDKVTELQKEINELQEELDSTKNEAQKMLLKMGKELSVSSVEVYGIKENLKKLTERLQDTIHGEVSESSYLRTPSQKVSPSDSSIGSALKTQLGEESTVFETKNVTSIGSETSAFSVVQPVASPTACDSEKPLPDVLQELSVSVCGFANFSAEVIDTKQQVIKDLGREFFLLKEELQRKEYQYKSDIRDLKGDNEKLERKTQSLNECLNRKQQCIRELEALVHQQEQKILQQLRKEKEQEEIFEENTALKQSLQLSENEVNLLKEEMVKNPTCAARDWIEEKLMLQKDLTKLRQMLIDTEATKSEIVHRSLKHRDILERNLAHAEKELKKLDDIIETIRETLMSIPDVVSSNEKLSQIMGYLK